MAFHRRFLFALFTGALLVPALARGEDVYVSLPLTDVIPAAKLPAGGTERSWRQSSGDLFPHIALDTAGAEAYFKTNVADVSSYSTSELLANARLTFRVPKAGPITGRLFLPTADQHSQVSIPFTAGAPEKADANAGKQDFLQAKLVFYDQLSGSGLPGGAWFRHQELATREALAKNNFGFSLPANRTFRGTAENSEFDILTGGRAMAENLQLDRALVSRKSDKPDVDIATLTGITVQKFDWTPLVKELKPALDPLASLIPADQHAMFFPSTEAFTTFIAEAGRSVLPVLEFSSESSIQDERIADRYSRQLGLPLAELDKKIPAGLIASIAVTGSDPSLRSGSAVSILFETKDPDALTRELEKLINGNAKPYFNPETFHGESTWRSPDRAVCVILQAVGNTVIVSNSDRQMEAVAKVHVKDVPSLASLDEYRYFRSRYPRSDQDETAFLVISDDTIRRWCGPKLRIAEAHRVRAAAVLAELEAAALENPEVPIALPGNLNMDQSALGKLSRVNGHIHSARYNTLAFLTPASELDLVKVPAADAESYTRWRDTYQQNWRQYFDPIALRLSLQKSKLAADLTVMPLIESSSYKQGFFSYLNGRFPPVAADPHKTLAQFVVGLDVTKPPLSETLPSLLPLSGVDKAANPFRWIGNNASVYLDADPFWEEYAKSERKGEFLERNAAKLPIGLRISCNNPLGQVAFLASLRSFIESSAPGMLQYTVLNYNQQPYIKVTASKPNESGLGEFKDVAIYYVPAPDYLLVTLNESLLKRAIDRKLGAASQPATAPATAAAGPPAVSPWLGQTLAAHLDAGFIRQIIPALSSDEYQHQLQRKAWAPLPILNDLKRLRPAQDALAVYSETFRETPVDPLGGSYSWDEKLQTYTSSTLGNPVAPKTPSQFPPALEALRSLDFGLTLENNNLRARAVLERKPVP